MRWSCDERLCVSVPHNKGSNQRIQQRGDAGAAFKPMFIPMEPQRLRDLVSSCFRAVTWTILNPAQIEIRATPQ